MRAIARHYTRVVAASFWLTSAFREMPRQEDRRDYGEARWVALVPLAGRL